MLVPPEARCPGPAARAAVAVLLAVSASLDAGAQGNRDWWDLHDDAKAIIENDKSTEPQLESARKSLLAALKARDGEGSFATYNPSVKIDYLPYFYLGWASMRLKKYDEAAKNFKKSDEIGFIKKGAPAALKAKFDNYQSLVTQLKPAADALTQARGNTLVNQCTAAAPRIKDTMSKIETFLSNPGDASALKGWISDLGAAQGDCAKEVGGRRLAQAMDEYTKAKEPLAVDGIAELLAPDTQKELEAALAAGADAQSKGDDKALKAAADRLVALPPKVARDVDGRMAGLCQDSDKLLHGNERALNDQNQTGSRLSALTVEARGQKAAGRSGKDLAAVVKTGVDLKGLIASARSLLAPVLQAKGGTLDGSRRDFDAWSGAHACEISAVGLKDEADAAVKEAAAARQGESADAMESAASKLASLRASVESKMKDALPRMQEEAKGALTGADSLLANLPDPAQKSRGDSLKNGIQQALAKNDVCGIESAIGDLNKWVAVVSPKLEADRKKAIARNQPTLDEGQRLMNSYGGILKPETVAALKAPLEKLAGLVKNSYDSDAMDKAGQELSPIVSRAGTELASQIQEGTRALKAMRSDPRWADVSAVRRQWLEQNLQAIDRPSPDPALVSRFALEYPRARAEMALAAAFGVLYENDDAARAAKTIEDLGPGVRGGSAALNYALSYFYWWQMQTASSSDKEALMAKAKEAFDAGKARGVDLAGLGAPLFAPAFVEEMSRR